MLDAIGIVSSDINASIQFYKKLGLELKQFEQSEHYECILPNGFRLMLDSEKLMQQINPQYTKTRGTGVTLCFKQGSPESLNHLVDQLEEENYKIVKKPWDAFWGQRYATLLDPDGNLIDVFAELKG